MTEKCNMSCLHCYADAGPHSGGAEMSGEDADAFLAGCAANSVPYLLLSGGEPLCCPDFFSYMKKAHSLGLKIALSTNGTLVDDDAAALLVNCAEYVGVSLDGPREIHDEFRGGAGAFDSSSAAIKRLASLGCRVGARVTLARPVVGRLSETLALMEELPLSRICFYRFIRSGRGARDISLIPDPADEDAAARQIVEWADRRHISGGSRKPLEVLTVGDASDSVRVYEYLDSKSDGRIQFAEKLMERAAGRPSGSGILSVRWDGVVFGNQFMWDEPAGDSKNLAAAAKRAAGRRTADECSRCGWRVRKICAGRVSGFGGKCYFAR